MLNDGSTCLVFSAEYHGADNRDHILMGNSQRSLWVCSRVNDVSVMTVKEWLRLVHGPHQKCEARLRSINQLIPAVQLTRLLQQCASSSNPVRDSWWEQEFASGHQMRIMHVKTQVTELQPECFVHMNICRQPHSSRAISKSYWDCSTSILQDTRYLISPAHTLFSY